MTIDLFLLLLLVAICSGGLAGLMVTFIKSDIIHKGFKWLYVIWTAAIVLANYTLYCTTIYPHVPNPTQYLFIGIVTTLVVGYIAYAQYSVTELKKEM